ncbi:MAG TPA: peptide chain release factor N(5)-glutamine methyltransferase [Ignavibacteriales bacterium]|nr:peptide chain release factor N(5)-glutamine methyltransferase [Ignavibacteriales bacterium]
MITVLEVIKLSTDYLQKKGVESPRANAEILLADILKCKRLELYLSFDKPLAENDVQIYREAIRKRGLRIPLQYIIGNVEFYGLKLLVNENVLIPRPETELLVEKIINESDKSANLKILDIGVGSGNISLALLKNLPNSKLVAIDISENALTVAEQNAGLNLLNHKIEFRMFDIFIDDLNMLGKFDLIVSNPPYVSGADFDNLEPELKIHEPRIALTDNSNGVSFYKRIIEISEQILNEQGKVYFELGLGQSAQVQKYFEQSNFKNIEVTKDYAGIDRIICGELK